MKDPKSVDTTVVAIGDSAMWGTGTSYRFKPPNLVHKLLNDGVPMPPVQLRARGGGLIGRSNSCGLTLTDANGTFDESYAPPSGPAISKADCAVDEPVQRPGTSASDVAAADAGDDDYGYAEPDPAKWERLNEEARTDSDLDPKNVDNLKWSIRRDIGRGFPTHLQQIDQFADWSPSRTLDVPRDGKRPITLHWESTGPSGIIPNPQIPSDNEAAAHVPATTPPKPETVDLVLLNGGTNDIGLFYMMNFLNDYNDLMRYTEKYCYRDNKYMLKKARERFPNAVLVLLGYPVFLSEWTDYTASREFLTQFGLLESIESAKANLAGALGGQKAIESVVDGGTVFSRSHHHYMRKAATECDHVDVRNGDPGVIYVARGFSALNAFEGPNPYAWTGEDDDTYERRKHFVEDILGESNAPKKVRAPIGHPNRRGSIQTAEAIVDRYLARAEQHRSVAELTSGAGGSGTRSVRQSLGTYSLLPNSFRQGNRGSLAHALSHRIVDSLQVRFYRYPLPVKPDGSPASDDPPYLSQDVDLYLDIEPGRSGNGESFRLDYEDDTDPNGIQPISNRRNTPQFDADSGEAPMDRDGDPDNDTVVTEVNIDPMMGANFDGGVQTNYGDDRSSKEDNVIPDSTPVEWPADPEWEETEIWWNRSDYGSVDHLPNDASNFGDANRWDARRLTLGEVQRARLRVDGASTWALKRIEFSINGELTWTTRRANGTALRKRFRDAADKDLGGFWIRLFP